MNYQKLDNVQLLKEYTKLIAAVNKNGSKFTDGFYTVCN